MARPPVPITLDPPRGQIPTVSVLLATDASTAAGWVAEAFGSQRWKRRASDAAHRAGAALWEIGGAGRAFLLDDLDVLRWVSPRATAFVSHGRAVATVGALDRGTSEPPAATVALSLVDGAFSCRESLAAVARGLRDRAVRAGALHPDDVPVWANAIELPAGSPLHPATGRKLFRRG
ncbi:hypothetical protein JN535_11395 [Cellulosimicrobium cellulans]|uniref:hypothetical protein n=1 Tax=Cellulosimicrobium cellulans TaxID=1710 RepID=UPI0019661D00|nr:hypothetical protein [Cellulosimicrobium cellulans]MBN0040768.1 hypothetical protein [Cellulosimicrobium cellulans]